MITGMTGFGNSAFSAGKIKGVLEIRTLNHRYFDLVFYLPVGFGALENKIRESVNKQIDRGRITVSLKITEKEATSLTFNKAVVKEYLKYARELEKEYGFENDLALSDLIRLPGVVEAKDSTVDPEQLWPAVEKALTRALASVVQMREREGKSLASDISAVLKRMSHHIQKIKARAEAILKEKKKKLNDDEFMSLQKGNDINEELARLEHYIDEFKALLPAAVSVGKKLDFVAQEMQRETNTIGSKLQDKIVANAVIALKSKVEKLREQAQNIE